MKELRGCPLSRTSSFFEVETLICFTIYVVGFDANVELRPTGGVENLRITVSTQKRTMSKSTRDMVNLVPLRLHTRVAFGYTLFSSPLISRLMFER